MNYVALYRLSLNLWDLLFSSRSGCFRRPDVRYQIYRVLNFLWDNSHALLTSSLQMRNLRCPNFLCPLASSHAVLTVARYFNAFALELPKQFDATAKYFCSRIGAVFLYYVAECVCSQKNS